MNIKLSIVGQVLTLDYISRIVSDTINYLTAFFTFSEEWNDLVKTAHFKNGNTIYNVVLEDDRIEHGLNLGSGKWELYVHGNLIVDGEVKKRITSNSVTFHITESGVLDGEPFPDLPPSVGEQYVGRMEQIKRETEELTEGMVRSINEEVPDELGNITLTAESVGALPADTPIPDPVTKTSELTNDSGFITDSALEGLAKESDLEEVKETQTKLNKDLAQLSEAYESTKAQTESQERRLVNLEYASRGVLYREEISDTVDYEKRLEADVMPYGTFDKLGGKSIVWNQISTVERIAWNEGYRGITIKKVDDATIRISGVVTESANERAYACKNIFPPNHKYYIDLKNEMLKGRIGNGSDVNVKGICIPTVSTESYLIFYIPKGTDFGDGIEVKPTIHDLTVMFGSGNEPTQAECEKIFTEDYYPYCEPVLMDAEVENIVVNGKICVMRIKLLQLFRIILEVMRIHQ